MTDRSDLTQRVALAICQVEHPNQDDEIYDLLVRDVPKYRQFAQAAIDALNLKERDAAVYADGYQDAVKYQGHLAGRRS